jgi:signal peptidase I
MLEVSHIDNSNPAANKAPWLAGSYSWLLPGLGHIYFGAYGQGICLIIIIVLLHSFAIASLISSRTSMSLPILLYFYVCICIPAYVSYVAYKLTKKHNTENFEKNRTLGRDPWLAVFLTLILPGLGHIYLRKHIAGILFFLSFLAIHAAYYAIFYVRFVAVVFMVVASAHAYGMRPHFIFGLKRPFTRFTLVLLFIGILKNILIPLSLNKFFLLTCVSGPCMDPTIPDKSRIVINKFIYSLKDPEIGDVVLFVPSDNAPSDYVRLTCKRIVAVGGETVQVRNSNVYVDGMKREVRGDVHRKARSQLGPTIDFHDRDNPHLVFGVHEPYRVHKGHYFLLGDNRHYSVDSRCFGAVPRENIMGKVVKIYWPPRYMGLVK